MKKYHGLSIKIIVVTLEIQPLRTVVCLMWFKKTQTVEDAGNLRIHGGRNLMMQLTLMTTCKHPFSSDLFMTSENSISESRE